MAVLRSLTKASKAWFRVVHFSVQTNHVHLIVEAHSRLALIRGVQGLAVRCAKAINRDLGRRGSVWASRYQPRWVVHLAVSDRAMIPTRGVGSRPRANARGSGPRRHLCLFESMPSR